MDFNNSSEYEDVKAAILRKYDINPETYRQRFCSLDIEPEESPKELYVRLNELYGKWIQPRNKSVEEIGELIIMEQFLRMLSPELQVWVKEHGPKSAAEASTLADVFVAACNKSQPWSYNGWMAVKAGKDSRRPVASQYHQRSTFGLGKPPIKENQQTQLKKNSNAPICFLCGHEGHFKPLCPKNPAKLTQICYAPRKNAVNESQLSTKITMVKINGENLQALIDTGSTQTLVHRRHVPTNIICTVETVPDGVHGDEKFYPTADMYIEVPGQTYLLNVGVADSLPYPVVLGEDLPVLFDLLNPVPSCNVVVTREKARQMDADSPVLRALPFFGAELETQPGKCRMPCSQKK